MIENQIGIRIKKIMDYLNLNYRSFGKKLGFSDVVVRNIIIGRNFPSFEFITKLIQTFDWIDINWLITGEGDMLRSPAEASAQKTDKNTDTEPLERLIDTLQQQVSSLQQQLSIMQQHIDSLITQNKMLIEQNKSLSEQLQHFAQLNRQLTEQLAQEKKKTHLE